MKRLAYETGSNPEITGPSNDLVERESATETGGRGFSSNEMTSDYDATDPDTYQENIPSDFHNNGAIMSDELLKLLVELGDGMDQNGEEHLANFADFLIKKFAEAQTVNYTEMFNQLMIKINNADIVNTNEILKKLAKIYSRTLVLEYMKNSDLIKSKESAYNKVLHRAEQYLSEG